MPCPLCPCSLFGLRLGTVAESFVRLRSPVAFFESCLMCLAVIELGRIRAAVWANGTKKGLRYNVTFTRVTSWSKDTGREAGLEGVNWVRSR